MAPMKPQLATGGVKCIRMMPRCRNNLTSVMSGWIREGRIGGSMIAAFIRTRVRAGKKQKLLEYFRWECQVATEEEPHVLRFDVFEDPTDENIIYYYEAYVDEAAYELHKTYPPFREWERSIKAECVERNEPVFRPGLTAVCTTG